MPTIVNSLPQGEKVGMAYSGGLDTSTAMLWMRMNGAVPIAYLADLGQEEVSSLGEVTAKALEYGAEKVNLLDCKRCVAELGIAVLQCRAFNIQTANCFYYNTTPIGRVAISVAASLVMKRDGVRYWSDGSTFKGNDIERFFKYGTLANPDLKFYKPWLDSRFVKELGGRKEMYSFLWKHGLRPRTPEQETFSVDSNLLGNSSEAKLIERLDFNASDTFSQSDSKSRITGPDAGEAVTISFCEGRPVSVNGKQLESVELIGTLNLIGKKYNLGISDQVEDRIIGLKSRGIYEAPAMHILFVAYERLVTSICDCQAISRYRKWGTALGRMLYCGDWFSPTAITIRLALGSAVTSLVSGEVTVGLQHDGCSVLDTFSRCLSYDSLRLSMEKGTSEFTAQDRLGQLNLVRPRMSETRGKVRRFGKMGLLHFSNSGIPLLD